MDRDKMIDEMARAIHMNCHKGLTSTEAMMIARWCYQEIDRKASDVAREIFEEIEKTIIRNHIESYKTLNDTWLYKFKNGIFIELAELKKKYTEGKDGT